VTVSRQSLTTVGIHHIFTFHFHFLLRVCGLVGLRKLSDQYRKQPAQLYGYICISSSCIKSVEWLAFLSHSRFVTVDVSPGTGGPFSSRRVFSDLPQPVAYKFLKLYSARLLHTY